MAAWIIPTLIIAAAIGFALWKHKDKLRAIFDRKDVQPDAPGVVVNPVQPTSTRPAIDYKRWGQYSAQEIMILPQLGRPDFQPGWDWKEWARVNGKPDPFYVPDTGPAVDRSGFVLTKENGYHVHPHVQPGQPYTFLFPEGVAPGIEVFPVGGDEITHVNGEHRPGGRKFPAKGGMLEVRVDGNGRNGQIWLGVKLIESTGD
jgi:hypothetical protein